MAFSLAAAGGISVLLGDVESEATFQVIGTTAVTGICSVAAFCGATLIGRRVQWFGSVTILLAFVTLLLSVVFLWGDPYSWGGHAPGSTGMTLGDIFYQVLSSFALVTGVASIFSLILLLTSRTWLVRIGLPITLGLLGLGTCLVLVTIWVESAWGLEWLTRVNGIVWILAALGVVIVPLTSLLLRAGTKPTETTPATTVTKTDAHAGMSVGSTQHGSAQPHTTQHGSTQPSSTLSPTTLDRIDAAARAEGITADELIDRLLTAEPRTPSADESR
ncbi:hypothetical protein [Brevibacterium sp. 'Marine']|uniref:hypothetical protein n=1 Tax=Brevibacterium sp. 'Marine' TaxID=2725563 RepID=UPI00145EA703|nr:hypothetical protein [Brevibacterium sp. 'Marine']